MNFIVATKSSTFLIGPIATALGWIMDGIFRVTNLVGVMNIGLSIILFTIVIKLILAPMSVKQQKFTRMNAYMTPEIQVIQDKYRGKKDSESMMKQNMEMQAVYQKYGVKPTAGCLQLLIQLPILFALYRVVYNIPAYVASVKDVYTQIVNRIIAVLGDAAWASNEILTGFAKTNNVSIKDGAFSGTDQLIDMLYNFDANEWTQLQEQISGLNIESQVDSITNMNSFLGISLFNSPSSYIANFQGVWPLIVALMIPILAGLTQWISVKISTKQTEDRQKKLGKEREPSAMESSMKMMTKIMPIMSVVFCFTLSSCIGVYWIISTVATLIIQLLVNRYMDKMDVNDIIKANIEKINAKRAKQGLPPQKIQAVTAQRVRNISAENDEDAKKAKEEERQDKIKSSTEYYKNASAYKPGSLAAKANMVKQYDERKAKK
ncbi:MAG: YidC/Oxa1 family membrane protein insertase [Lachnospiraceae bacterium]|nr:YidC/Oxa1 family membrane protein insertase [Lachnospiraceae bacterium]